MAKLESESCWGITVMPYEKWLGRIEGSQRVLLVYNAGSEATEFKNRAEFLFFVEKGKKFFRIE